VQAALNNPERTVLRLVATKNAAQKVYSRKCNADILEAKQISKLVGEESVHQGVAALVEALPELILEEVLKQEQKKASSVLVALDQVTDPHNIGAIMRSSAAFGAAGLIVTDRHSPSANAIIAKSASGGLESVPLVRVVNLSASLKTCKDHGFWCVGLSGDAKDNLHKAKLPEKIVLVLGAEGEGLRRLTQENCDLMVKIAMSSGMESLNVSNAAAVSLHHIYASANERR
jgi:23S rRNA (guanosine2251-2'-O)-methyltransferase